jgi:acyl-CoA thioesterase
MPLDGDDGTPVGPLSRLLGFRLLESGADGVVGEARPQPDHLNGGGIVHGGYLSALLDSATGWAVHAQLGEGRLAPHTHLSVQYVRAATAGEPLRVEARCIRAGSRVAAAEAEITQGGRVVARGVSSHAVIDRAG